MALIDRSAAEHSDTVRLLEHARTGSRKAFDELFALHREELRRLVEIRMSPKLRARVDASDIVQETQLEAFVRLNEYLERKPMPFRVWLIKTAYQQVIGAHRHHVSVARRSVDQEVPCARQPSWDLLSRFVENASSPSKQLSRKETSAKVAQVLLELANGDREILLLRAIEGRPYDEIGLLLQVDASAARQRYARALLRLRTSLSRLGLLDD